MQIFNVPATDIVAVGPISEVDSSIPAELDFLEDPNSIGEHSLADDEEQQDLLSVTRLAGTHVATEHSASLIIDTLLSFPLQMTRRETFPCFIHAQTGWKLPEPLTICMHIALLFASPSHDIRPFMWRSILAEQTRILQQARLDHASSAMTDRDSYLQSRKRISWQLFRQILSI